jgi:hypothetical protein
MPVGAYGVERHTVLRAKEESLTILEFKSGRVARECLARLRVCGYDSGHTATIEHIGAVAEAAVAYQAEQAAKREAEKQAAAEERAGKRMLEAVAAAEAAGAAS